MPSAANRTLAIIAQYADVRPSTWERDVKGVQRPEVEALLQEINNEEEADRMLGKPLFEWAMDNWPQLRKVVEIGVQRYIYIYIYIYAQLQRWVFFICMHFLSLAHIVDQGAEVLEQQNPV